MNGQGDYELIYRSPEGGVSVDIISASEPGQRLLCLVVDEIERDYDEAGGSLLAGDIRRLINRLEAAQEAIEERYRL